MFQLKFGFESLFFVIPVSHDETALWVYCVCRCVCSCLCVGFVHCRECWGPCLRISVLAMCTIRFCFAFVLFFSSKLYISTKLTLVSYAALEHKIRSLHSCPCLSVSPSCPDIRWTFSCLRAGSFQAGSLALNTRDHRRVCMCVCVCVCVYVWKETGLLDCGVTLLPDTLCTDDHHIICILRREEKPIHRSGSSAAQNLSHYCLFRQISFWGFSSFVIRPSS